MKVVPCLLLALAVPLSSNAAIAALAKRGHDPVTVPMQVELNRPYVDLSLTGPNGRNIEAHAWVDTGGGSILLSAGLAKRLGLRVIGKTIGKGEDQYARSMVPTIHIGGEKLSLARNSVATIMLSQPTWLNHTDADMALPARDLIHYVVVFDYPAHTFTLGDRRTFKVSGTPVATYIGSSGMPVVWLKVAGKIYGFLLDTGGQFCMIEQSKLNQWAKAHASWPRIDGAYGPANMQLGSFDQKLFMLRIGAMQWGPFNLKGIGAVSRPDQAYEKFMSGIVDKPIIGSIAGNVLRNFRVTVDYPDGKIYLKREKRATHNDISMVGIMLEPTAKEGYRVVKTTSGLSQSSVKVGDLLLKVDGQSVTQAPFSRVVILLGGPPGTMHTLVVQRGKVELTVRARAQLIF